MWKVSKVLWFLTQSDILTFVVPNTAFGMLGALSGARLTTNQAPQVLVILARLPIVFAWNFSNTAVFDLANQRLPESTVEEALNKPWRPIPRGCITPVQMRRLLLGTLPVVLLSGYFWKVFLETTLLFVLTWMYNDLQGSDEDFVLRNLLIALAALLYNGGSLRIACGSDYGLSTAGYYWTAMVAGIIFSTIQIQDLKDVAGDRARKRRSAPIVLGENPTRVTISLLVITWSILCPLYLDSGLMGYVLPLALGFVVAARTTWMSGLQTDRRSWQLWTGWLMILYLLPLM